MSTKLSVGHKRRRVTASAVAAVGLITGVGLAAASAAGASAPTASTSTSLIHGTCSMGSVVTLQLQKSDRARIDAGFEVDHARASSVWAVRLTHNSSVYFTGRRTTRPDGSFSVDRVLRNLSRRDAISGRARDLSSGQVCTVSGHI